MSHFFVSSGQSIGASASNISPSNEYSGLISFRIDWFDLIAVQWTLKSLLQHQSSKTSSLQHSAFFIVQLSHSYMITGKTIALTIQTFVGQVMSLLFNILCRLLLLLLSRFSRVRLCVTPETAALQASPSPWTEKPGGLQSLGSQRVRHN